MSPLLTTGPSDAPVHLLLAHGAGAPMTSPFLDRLTSAFAGHGVQTTRFEFDYMARRRTDGVKRPPPKMERLTVEFRSAIAALAPHNGQRFLIGGKSMGGRVASLIADDLFAARAICGLVCLGYPFHPPKKPASLRTQHLQALICPTLIIQGERDPFGTRSEVAGYDLSRAVELHWLADGDHDFKPRRSSGHTQAGHIETAAAVIAQLTDAP